MKKLISVLLMGVMLLSMFCGCKEKVCDMCGDTYRGKSHTVVFFGTGEVCGDCYKEFQKLG